MAVITVQRVVNRPLAEVWDALADFGGIYKFHPVVASSPVKEGTPDRGVGSERVCTFYDGNSIDERVTAYTDKQSMTVEIVRASMPLNSAVARFDVAPAPQGTSVTMTMDFEPKYGPIGWLMAELAMKPQFTKILNNLLLGLEEHLETGAIIDQDWKAA